MPEFELGGTDLSSGVDASYWDSSVEVYFRDAEAECDSICCEYLPQRSRSPIGWEALPDGLLWHSYLAGPHEPRMSTIIFSDAHGGVFWDAALGGRVGFLRYRVDESPESRSWQWDLEGAVITRLDLLNSEDVESMDYRFGTEITMAQGQWAGKFGYFHVSAHVGDEYLISNPLYQRVNYVTESLVLGIARRMQERWRVYGESAYAFHTAGGAKKWQFQTGLEYAPKPSLGDACAPFSAINFDIREAVNFDPSITIQTGWSWYGSRSARRFRAGLQYTNGYSSQFQFFQRFEENLGAGIWFDY